jgi:predicted nucleotidyltransferase
MKSTDTHTDLRGIEPIKGILQGVPGLQVAILYGSAASGKMRADSDVDIALLFGAPMDAGRKMELISQLGSTLQRDVDLIDLFALNGTILKQVLRNGRVLIQTEPGALAKLAQRMIYNQADMMPYVSRTLIERQRRFIHG